MKKDAVHQLLISALALAIALLSFTACIVIPHPRNIAMARGIETKKPKLESIRVNETTREELKALLGPFETDASHERFFWARWQQVKVQVEWFVAAAAVQAGAQGGMDGGSERVWKILNVLALFDEKNTVRYYRLCDEGDLLRRLRETTSQLDPALDVTTKLVLPASHLHIPSFSQGQGRIVVGRGRVSFEEPGKPAHNADFPVDQTVRLELVHGSSPEVLHFDLHIQKESTSRHFNLQASPAEAVRLVALID